MANLRAPTHSSQVIQELTGANSRVGVTNAERVRVIDIEDAPGGNSTNDHLKNIYARLSNFHGDGEWKGTYSNSATYAVGDEVDWTDPTDKLLFFKCILAGDDGGSGTPLTNTNRWIPLEGDIHDLNVVDESVPENTGILEHLPNGTIQFNRRIWSAISEKIDDEKALEIADNLVDFVVKTSRWRGDWKAGFNYLEDDFVKYNSVYYLRQSAGSDGASENPHVNSSDWSRATGTDLLIAQRLEDVSNLLAQSLKLMPAEGNRGHWIARTIGAETYAYALPPMQFKGNWSAAATYYFGHVVVHNNDTWALSGVDQITTGKTGIATAPGTDSAWVKLTSSTSSLAGFPHYRGEWADANGQKTFEGDVWRHNEGYYIRRTGTKATPGTINTGGSGPDTDPTHYALIDVWDDNGWNTNRWYHPGTMLRHKDEVFIADQVINNTDPEPVVGGTFNSSIKWRQITGITPAMEQIRRDLESLIHSGETSRGVLQDSLALPVASDSTPLVWLARKSFRNWTIPIAKVAGTSTFDIRIGDEPGEYKLTSGTANRAKFVCGKHTHGSGAAARDYYGLITRAENNSEFPANIGTLLHAPVGAGLIAAVAEQLSGTDGWRLRVLLKENIVDAILKNADPKPNLYLKVYDSDGAAQAGPVSIGNSAAHTYIFNGVTYYEMVSDRFSAEPTFKTLYDAGTDDESRTLEVSLTFGTNGAGVDAWMGDNAYGYTRQPPISSSDDIEIVSEDVHQVIVLARTDYDGLAQLAPKTMYLVHGSS